jgi:Flp pilus assembly protein TadD
MRLCLVNRRWVWLVVALAGGCATHHTTTLQERLIKPGKPSVEIGSPPPSAPKKSLEAYIAQMKRLSERARPASLSSLAPSIESQTPALQAALLQVRINPTAESYRHLGEAYRDVGILDAAHKYLSRAVVIDPTDARAYDGLARIWRDWGSANLGLGDARRAVYYAPDSPEAHNTLGTLLQSLGQRAEARVAYQHALALDPDASYALNNLCYLSFLDGDGVAALTQCQSALKITPNATATRNNLGLVYASLGEVQAAQRHFSSENHPERAAYNMGLVQLAKGQFSQAAESFRAAYAANPSLRSASQYAKTATRLAQLRSTPENPEDLKHDR